MLSLPLFAVQAQIPLTGEALEGAGGGGEVGTLAGGIAQKKCRDRCRRPVDGVRGIAGDVEQQLNVDVRNVDADLVQQCRSRRCGPVGEFVVGHTGILSLQAHRT